MKDKSASTFGITEENLKDFIRIINWDFDKEYYRHRSMGQEDTARGCYKRRAGTVILKTLDHYDFFTQPGGSDQAGTDSWWMIPSATVYTIWIKGKKRNDINVDELIEYAYFIDEEEEEDDRI